MDDLPELPDFEDILTPDSKKRRKKKRKSWEVGRRLLLASVILIFLIFTTYNISMYLVHTNYSKTNDLTEELDKMIEEVGEDSPLYDRLVEIRGEVAFMNAFCYNKDVTDMGDVLE